MVPHAYLHHCNLKKDRDPSKQLGLIKPNDIWHLHYNVIGIGLIFHIIMNDCLASVECVCGIVERAQVWDCNVQTSIAVKG